MRLFDVAQPVVGNQIQIPYGMRAALGWHSKMRVYCWSHRGDGQDGLIHRNQISISAYPPDTRELWHLAVRFRDRPGIVAELSSLLTDVQVDIITCRGSTHLQNSEFSVDMELDTSSYHSDYDLTREDRKRQPGRGLPELHARIACTFIHDIIFTPDGAPSLTITRNPILTGSIFADEFRYDSVLKTHGVLTLPKAPLNDITSRFTSKHPKLASVKGTASRPLVLLTADTRWGVMDATLYFRNTGYKHVRVSARDQIGSLERVTSELRGHEFNVLQLYSRVVPNTGIGYMDMLLYLPSDRIGDDEKLAAYIRGLLRGKALRDLDMGVTFPRPATARYPRKRGRA